MKKPVFYKLSFWIDGIILSSKAYCFFPADNEDEAIKLLFSKHGHFKLYGLTFSKVPFGSQTYKVLCSIYHFK